MADVLYEKRGDIAWVTFNRPQRKNTWTAESFVRLSEAWQDFSDDPQLRVAVVTGAGEEAFSAGGDLKALIPLFTGAADADSEMERRFLSDPGCSDRALMKDGVLAKPVIAAVNGLAYGGGFEMVLATDLRIASETARFALPEVRHAIVPGAGSMVRLPRQVGYARAMELLLSGDSISAEQALAWGLINRVVPAAELLERAADWAARLAACGPLAQAAIKRVALESTGLPLAEAFALERAQAAVVMASADAREGPRAFAEKRAARYAGQ